MILLLLLLLLQNTTRLICTAKEEPINVIRDLFPQLPMHTGIQVPSVLVASVAEPHVTQVSAQNDFI